MKIIKYKYSDVEQPAWNYQEIELGKMNLLVGQSASGKTRLLNTIFNWGTMIAQEGHFKRGHWSAEVKAAGQRYKIEMITRESDKNKPMVENEIIKVKVNDEERVIVQRDKDGFFFDGKKLPKLPLNQSSIYLLKDEELIQPLHKGFSSIVRRSFFENEAKNQSHLTVVTKKQEEEYKSKKDDPGYMVVQSINTRLFLLKKYEPVKYKRIIDFFKNVFPFIKEVDFHDVTIDDSTLFIQGKVAVFSIKEKNIDKWIPYIELSSGVQKVLLILTDIETLIDGSIYLIDEYENSLGTNAIDFFPSYFDSSDKDCQLIMTSHHPYLINNVSPKDWYVFHRNGSEVKIKFGSDNLERFGKSKQKSFIQLMNDPFFTEGVE